MGYFLNPIVLRQKRRKSEAKKGLALHRAHVQLSITYPPPIASQRLRRKSTHPSSMHPRVKNRRNPQEHRAQAPSAKNPMLPVYYQGQDSELPAAHCSTLEDCRKLRAEDKGVFINRGTAFRRTDVPDPDRNKKYRPSRPFSVMNHGDSCVINGHMMQRFAAGDQMARIAVAAWR